MRLKKLFVALPAVSIVHASAALGTLFEDRRNREKNSLDVLRGRQFVRAVPSDPAYPRARARSPAYFALARRTEFEVRLFHIRGGGVRIAVGGRIPQSRRLGEFDQREHDRRFALSGDVACLQLSQRRPQRQIAWNHVRAIRSQLVGPQS
jgi:hypothetical protein